MITLKHDTLSFTFPEIARQVRSLVERQIQEIASQLPPPWDRADLWAEIKAEAASLEMLMSSSEIQAGLRLCREFDGQERSRQPHWMTDMLKGIDIDQTWRPLNETTP
jgi:hypothetical protein